MLGSPYRAFFFAETKGITTILSDRKEVVLYEKVSVYIRIGDRRPSR